PEDVRGPLGGRAPSGVRPDHAGGPAEPIQRRPEGTRAAPALGPVGPAPPPPAPPPPAFAVPRLAAPPAVRFGDGPNDAGPAPSGARPSPAAERAGAAAARRGAHPRPPLRRAAGLALGHPLPEGEDSTSAPGPTGDAGLPTVDAAAPSGRRIATPRRVARLDTAVGDGAVAAAAVPSAGAAGRPPPSAPPPPPARAAPEPPPIEISIGHIEVRAPRPPAPRATPPPARLAVGLSEYLQARNQGDR